MHRPSFAHLGRRYGAPMARRARVRGANCRGLSPIDRPFSLLLLSPAGRRQRPPWPTTRNAGGLAMSELAREQGGLGRGKEADR
eukprot:544143-Pyramimonas_sp.AAC.1